MSIGTMFSIYPHNTLRQQASSLLEMIAVLSIVSIIINASYANFSPRFSLLPLRLASIKIQNFLRDSVEEAQYSSKTKKIFVKNKELVMEQGSSIKLGAGISIKNPTTISIYPTRVVSPYTIVLVNTAGECRITLSLRARIKIACFLY